MEKQNVPDSNISKLSFQDIGNVDEGDENVIKTDWKAVTIAGIVTFIAAVENTVVGMSEWAYMNEIDKIADAQFFGNATSASRAFHAISALIFSIWTYKSQSFRLPLIFGRIIAFIACIIYLCVEFVENGRRYVFLLCYILFGVASSSSSILRAYVAAISVFNDRPQAYSAITAAIMLSIIVGPSIQAIFTGISYPGYEIFPNVRFHIYSAPVWVAASTNFFSIAIIFFFLKELPKRAKNTIAKNKSMLTFSGIKNRIEKITKMKLNWPMIILCWIMKMVMTISITTLTTLLSIIYLANYGWSRSQTVFAISIVMGCVGILSLTISISYFFCNLGKILSQRFAYLIGTILFAAMYIFGYPWRFISEQVAPYNSTLDIGCNSSKYEWCSDSYAPNPLLLFIVIGLAMGIGIPLAGIALDAIYSKCLGTIDQSLMQGAMVVAEDFILILGPIYSSTVFTYYGFGSLWAINGVILLIGVLLWIFNFKRLNDY